MMLVDRSSEIVDLAQLLEIDQGDPKPEVHIRSTGACLFNPDVSRLTAVMTVNEKSHDGVMAKLKEIKAKRVAEPYTHFALPVAGDLPGRADLYGDWVINTNGVHALVTVCSYRIGGSVHMFTASPRPFLVLMLDWAKQRGYQLDATGLYKGDTHTVACPMDHLIFAELDLGYMPVEIRQFVGLQMVPSFPFVTVQGAKTTMYKVALNTAGVPVSCTCKDFVYRRTVATNPCKHMLKILEGE